MTLLEPGSLVTLVFEVAAVFSVLRYYTIFRHSFQLRKARAFLHYKQYEPIIIAIGIALLAATALILYTLATNPASLQLYDVGVYMSLQLLLASGLAYTFWVSRKAGK